MRIKKIILKFFKGMVDKVIEFDGDTCINGDNATGKTTTATAYYWLLCDKDYDLQSNPRVRHEENGIPVDDPDVSVELIVDIDGVEHSLKKIQKCRKSKPDANGAVKTTTTNSYEVNAVPLNERDFTAKMLELGIDLSKVLECTHPDVFMQGKVADRRNKLFALAGSHSDLELAQQGADTALLAEQLGKYSLTEVEAMNKASRKKCDEELKSIPGKIEGMVSSKKDIDIAEWELAKADLNRQLKELEAKESDNSKVYKEYSDIELKIFELGGFEKNDIIRRANESLDKQKSSLQSEIAQMQTELMRTEAEIRNADRDINARNADLPVYVNAYNKALEDYKAEKRKTFNESAWIFDEKELICPRCGQALPSDKQKSTREDFEKRKKEEREYFNERQRKMLEHIEEEGKIQQRRKKDCEQAITNAERIKESSEIVLMGQKSKLKAKQAELTSLPECVDLADNAELKALEAQIEELKSKLDKMSKGDELKAQLKAERDRIAENMKPVDEAFTLYRRNGEIEEQIEILKEQRIDLEQKKADAENILYQIKLLSKRKNERLEEEVNSHFNIVKWRLFTYQADGTVIDCCEPLINGRDFTYAANGARKILAKLDICVAFQKFYGVNLPIFLDEANEINIRYLPKFDFQLIQLRVSDDKELRVERSE